jgi:hypothetical protein
MTADPAEPSTPPNTVEIDGRKAVVVPMDEYRRLKALERHASAEALEEAEIEATLADYREWEAAGRPGAQSHEEVMAELLGNPR